MAGLIGVGSHRRDVGSNRRSLASRPTAGGEKDLCSLPLRCLATSPAAAPATCGPAPGRHARQRAAPHRPVAVPFRAAGGIGEDAEATKAVCSQPFRSGHRQDRRATFGRQVRPEGDEAPQMRIERRWCLGAECVGFGSSPNFFPRSCGKVRIPPLPLTALCRKTYRTGPKDTGRIHHPLWCRGHPCARPASGGKVGGALRVPSDAAAGESSKQRGLTRGSGATGAISYDHHRARRASRCLRAGGLP
jgi:hypothetical protein